MNKMPVGIATKTSDTVEYDVNVVGDAITITIPTTFLTTVFEYYKNHYTIVAEGRPIDDNKGQYKLFDNVNGIFIQGQSGSAVLLNNILDTNAVGSTSFDIYDTNTPNSPIITMRADLVSIEGAKNNTIANFVAAFAFVLLYLLV